MAVQIENNRGLENNQSLSELKAPASTHHSIWTTLTNNLLRPSPVIAAIALSVAPEAGIANASEAFVPNDPYFYATNTPGFWGQWNLDKQGTGATVDINVRGAWNMGFTGKGVTIGIVDTGVQYTHPDLVQNYDAANSWNFIENNASPLPDTSDVAQAHGTSVAGIVSAQGGNGVGITGVAPGSRFAAERVTKGALSFSDTTTLRQIADGLRYHSTGAAPTIHIKNYSSGERGAFGALMYPALTEIEQAARDNAASGAITVTISQNYRQQFGIQEGYDADANRKYLAHIPEVITVAALNFQGEFAQYSGWGACLTATIPSGETIWNGGVNLFSTDMLAGAGYNPNKNDTFSNPDYNSVFGGTSASAPTLSGVLALAIEAHNQRFGDNLEPCDKTRFYKQLLANTCRPIDLSDETPMGGWSTNAAGYKFNNNYGFGVVDAAAMTVAAQKYSGITPLTTNTTRFIYCNNTEIPLGDPAGISNSFSISPTNEALLEEVQVRVLINADEWYHFGRRYAQIQGVLTSPSGTKSLLMYANPLANNITDPATYEDLPLDWVFVSNAFWGENPTGKWTLTLSHPNESNGYFDAEYYLTGFEVILRGGKLILATAVAPTLTNPQPQRDGSVRFNLMGEPGTSYGVEASSDAISWIRIFTGIVPVNGVMEVSDSPGVNTSQRFYRAAQE